MARTDIRPHAWHYKDPFDHARHMPFLRWRAQCHYRKEPVELTIEDWFLLWADPEVWRKRGRQGDAYAITRIDPELPWSYANCRVVTRREQCQMAQQKSTESRI